MCGLVAIFGGDPRNVDAFVRRLLSRLAHRGEPDKQNEMASWSGVCMGANRLALTSAVDGTQPIPSDGSAVAIVYNGEVYNARALADRARLDAAALDRWGDGFAVASLIERDGLRAVADLEGMFAFVGIDLRTKRGFAVRDPLGIKPLYYARVGGRVIFASEMKALAPEADVAEILEVPAGSCLELTWEDPLRAEILGTTEYFSLTPMPENPSLTPPGLFAALRKSVEQCAHYSGRVGVYLSGGVDSGAVYALARPHRDMVALVLAGPDGTGVDVRAARRLVGELGGRHVEVACPTEDDLFESVAETIRVVESFEPNLVRQSSVQRCIAALARREGCKVVLCGEGADELFCGYPDFQTPGAEWEALRTAFLRDLARTQLQRVDRTSMHETTEVRVPYLNRAVVEAALGVRDVHRLVSGERLGVSNKLLLRESLRGHVPGWLRLRRKVVLSEGVGLGGNDPARGLFSRQAEAAIPRNEATGIVAAFPEWSLQSKEEAYYFRIFANHGYAKARFARRRVRANTVASLRWRPGVVEARRTR